jgi:Protein of unknown function (DUF998)
MSIEITPATRNLLRCGAIAGPLFLLVVLLQDYTRSGVDPRTQQLSLLSLGDWGWVQILNFVVAGALNLMYAIGLRRLLPRQRSGDAAALLIGTYGLGLVAVGVFATDPANGYPPGVVEPPSVSWHGALHVLGALVVFLALTGALLSFARLFRDRREPAWSAYALMSAALLVALWFAAGSTVWMARALRLGTLVGCMAASLIALKLSTTDPPGGQAGQPRD